MTIVGYIVNSNNYDDNNDNNNNNNNNNWRPNSLISFKAQCFFQKNKLINKKKQNDDKNFFCKP